MGKYILAVDVDRFHGSRGGSTFQKCGQVFSIRKRNTPVQKRSASQSRVKSTFNVVRKNYKTLSAPDKATFESEASNYPRTDSLGNVYFLHGNILHASSNLNLAGAGLPFIPSIPSPASFTPFTVTLFAMDIATGDVNVSLSLGNVPADQTLQVFMSRPLAPGIDIASANFVLIDSLPAGTVIASHQFGPSYQKAWGSFSGAAFQIAYARCVFVSADTGQKSDASTAQTQIS